MSQSAFLAALDQPRLVQAIADAEKQTSGEIRLHIQPRVLGGPIRSVAERTFERLGMTKTEQRNGVLLFIASEDRQFVILGDKGIDEKVPDGFWDDVAAQLGNRFRAGEFTDGIVEAIAGVGEHLRRYFPYAAGDRDELSNELSIEE
jgi:uncharacterized membrane protein